jgi:hypothetical protein
MKNIGMGTIRVGAMCAMGMLVGAMGAGTSFAQTGTADSGSAKSDQWIHVRVESRDSGGETVRVNVPIEMAAKVLPAINKDRLHEGKVRIDAVDTHDVDLRTILDAVRNSRDGEYVTVQSQENNVRVAKSAGMLLIHVTDKEGTKKNGKDKESKVEIKVPMKVVDALFSAGKDELDLVAALRALSAHGDTELISVKDEENTVRVWVDSKNLAN